MEGSAHLGDHGDFLVGKSVIACNGAVFKLAGGLAYGDYGHVVGICQPQQVDVVQRHLWDELDGEEGLQALRRALVLLLDVCAVGLFQIGVDSESGVLQALDEVHHISVMHVARAGSAGDETVGSAAEDRGLAAVQRKRHVVFEQHHAFCGGVARNGRVRLKARLVVGLVAVEGRGPEDVFQDALYVAVKVFYRKGAVFEGLVEGFHLFLVARHQQVVACLEHGYGVGPSVPVAHHHPVEAPVAAKPVFEKPLAFRRHGAVDAVVGRHYSPGLAFLDGYLEGLQVDLFHCPFAHARIVAGAVGLLVVEGEVLDRHADAVALQAADFCSAHFACQQRIFAQILEVAAAERVAHYVGCGREQHVGAVMQCLIAYCGSHFLHKGGVPGGAHQHLHGEMRAVEGAFGADPGGIYPEAGRAVRQRGGGDAQSRDGVGLPCGARNERAEIAHRGGCRSALVSA